MPYIKIKILGMKVKLFVYLLFIGFVCFGQPSNYDSSETIPINGEIVFDTLKRDDIKAYIKRLNLPTTTGYYTKVVEKYNFGSNSTVYVSDFVKLDYGRSPKVESAYDLHGLYYIKGYGYSKGYDYVDPNTKEMIGIEYGQHGDDLYVLMQNADTYEYIMLINRTFLWVAKNIDVFRKFESHLLADGIEVESDNSFTYKGKNLKIVEYTDELIAGNFNFYKTGSKGYETNLAKLKAGLDAFAPYHKKLIAHEKIYRIKGSNMPMSELNAWKATCTKAVPIFKKLDTTFNSVLNSDYYSSTQTTTDRYVNVMEFVSNCNNMF